MKNIILIVGTRPEALKLAPVYLALRHLFNVTLVSTGQHKEMVKPVFDFFEIIPDTELNTMVSNQSLSAITGLLFLELNKVIENISVDLLIVQGDTTSAMVAALVGYYHKIPVAHVEAGLRTGDKFSPFPEEINRTVISLVADLNFAPTPKAAENLQGAKNVHVVGNPIIDSLKLTLDKISSRRDYADRYSKLIDTDRPLVLVTAHRRESFGHGLHNICEAIKLLCFKYPRLQFLFPVHLNPNVKGKVHAILEGNPSIHLMSPLPYDDMVFLMARAYIILTDSGGIQEEAPSLGVPLVVMRDVTERPEGIEAGCAILSGTQVEEIVRAFDRIYTSPKLYQIMKNAGNPYGDGQAANRIAVIIRRFFL